MPRPLHLALIALGLQSGTAPLAAQPAQTFEQRVAQASRSMAYDPLAKDLSADKRRAMVEFVVGNMLFAVAHEMGHAIVTEMELPVLGREEDAADSFAIVAGLKMMSDFSERALIDAGKGWFFNDLRDKKQGAMAAFYDAHGMNLQRAYQIVCFMVGAAPEKFRHLAEMTKLPANRQRTCKDDYAIAAWSWEQVLTPHLRTKEQPRTEIAVAYGEGKGPLAVHAAAFKELEFLEMFAGMAAERYKWKSPFAMEMRSCGFVNATWSVKARKVTVCYELADEFATLFREFAGDPDMSKYQEARQAGR